MDKIVNILPLISEEEILGLLSELVQTRSYNPPGEEEKMMAKVAEWFTHIGAIVTEQKVLGERANVIARLIGDGSRPSLLMCTHLDTVPTGETSWLHNPLGAEIMDNCLYGRGAVDAKGSLVAMMIMAKILRMSGVSLHGDLVILATVDEEVGNLGALTFRDSGGMVGIGNVIIGEPTSLDLVIAHRGDLVLEITTHGKTAHSSMPETGVNAILSMAEILIQLSGLSFEKTFHPLLRPTTINISTIKGGTKSNMVPDLCKSVIDIRTVPGQLHSEIVAQVNAISKSIASKSPELTVEVRIIDDCPPLVSESDTQLINAGLNITKTILKRQPVLRGAPYYTDGGILIRGSHIPTLIFGPGDQSMAHQTDENIELNQVITAVKFYLALAIQLLVDNTNTE